MHQSRNKTKPSKPMISPTSPPLVQAQTRSQATSWYTDGQSGSSATSNPDDGDIYGPHNTDYF